MLVLEKMVWSSAASVGVQKLDDQHKKLFEMLNQLADCHAARGVQSSEAFLKILSAMFDYVAVHFKAEEGYLKNIEFPGLSAHAREHDAFVEAMADFNMAALEGKRDEVAVHQYLKEWLLNHILKSDMQYRRFAEGCDSPDIARVLVQCPP